MSDGQHFIGKISQRALITKDGKALITRHPIDQNFGLPGGRLDATEEPMEGLKREVKEELGLDVEITRPLGVQLENYAGGPHYCVTFEVAVSNPQQQVTADPAEVAEVRWVGAEEAQSVPLYPQTRQTLVNFFNSDGR